MEIGGDRASLYEKAPIISVIIFLVENVPTFVSKHNQRVGAP